MFKLLRKLKPSVSKTPSGVSKITSGVSKTPLGVPVGVSKNVSENPGRVDSQSLRVYHQHVERVFVTAGIIQPDRRVLKLSRVDRGFRHFGLGYQFLTYRAASNLDKALKLAEQIGLATGSENVRAYRDAAWLVYEFQLPESKWRSCSIGDLPDPAAVGLAANNKPVFFDFDRPHAGVFGISGSGKTNTIRAMVRALALRHDPEDLALAICDPNVFFDDFTNLAHLVCPIAQTEEDMHQVVNYVFGEFKRRQTGKIKDAKRLVLVLDEASETIPKAKGPERDRMLAQVEAICRQGRAFKVNIVFGTQSAKEDDFPGILKMLDNRFCGRVRNAQQSYHLTGFGGLEAHKLTGKGDFLHVGLEGTAARFQVPWVTERDLQNLPRREVGPVEAIPVERVEVDLDGDEESTAGPGRTRATVEAPVLAQYAFYYATNGQTLPSVRAAQGMGFGRTTHRIHVDFWKQFLAEYKRLRHG